MFVCLYRKHISRVVFFCFCFLSLLMRVMLRSHLNVWSCLFHHCHACASAAFDVCKCDLECEVFYLRFKSIFSTIRASNTTLMPSKNTCFPSLYLSTVYTAYLSVLCWFLSLWLFQNEPVDVVKYVCYRLSMVGNYLCEQQPTSPSKKKNSEWVSEIDLEYSWRNAHDCFFATPRLDSVPQESQN